MAEVASFESSSHATVPLVFERSVVDPIRLARVQDEGMLRQTTYRRHDEQARKEAEEFLGSIDSVFSDAYDGMKSDRTVGASVGDITNVRDDAPRFSALSPSEGVSDREKIATYGKLADLAYADLVRTSGDSGVGGKLQVQSVGLDALSFPNIRAIEKSKDLTDNEQRLLQFIRSHSLEDFAKDLRSFDSTSVSRDASELLYIASSGKFDATGIERKMAMRRGALPNQADTHGQIRSEIITNDAVSSRNTQYANIDSKYQRIQTDGVSDITGSIANADIQGLISLAGSDLSRDEKLNIIRLNAGLEHIRKHKTQEMSSLFEDMQARGFRVTDHFPDEDRGDNRSSGFSAIAIKDLDGKLHISIRGTELTDFGDIKADFRLLIGRMPENQTRDLITFMERNLLDLPEGAQVRIIGHSLGGALSQLGSVMFDDRVEETYTFNSPGAKRLSVSSDGYSGITREKFEKYANFEYTQDSTSVESRMTNVQGTKGPSIISNLGNDIGRYKIDLKELTSHSMTRLVEYVEKEAGEEELHRQDIFKKEEKETDPKL